MRKPKVVQSPKGLNSLHCELRGPVFESLPKGVDDEGVVGLRQQMRETGALRTNTLKHLNFVRESQRIPREFFHNTVITVRSIQERSSKNSVPPSCDLAAFDQLSLGNLHLARSHMVKEKIMERREGKRSSIPAIAREKRPGRGLEKGDHFLCALAGPCCADEHNALGVAEAPNDGGAGRTAPQDELKVLVELRKILLARKSLMGFLQLHKRLHVVQEVWIRAAGEKNCEIR